MSIVNTRRKLKACVQMAHRYTDIRKACAKKRRCTGLDGLRENLATLCSHAWVRSNFLEQGGPQIVDTQCDGPRLTVYFRDGCETAELYFQTEEDARKAQQQIPTQPCEYFGAFKLAGHVDIDTLSKEMNGEVCAAMPSYILS